MGEEVHLHHHLKTVFSERVMLWEGAGIEDKEVELRVKQQKLPSCPLDARQACQIQKKKGGSDIGTLCFQQSQL